MCCTALIKEMWCVTEQQFGVYLCVILQGTCLLKVNNTRGSYDGGLQFWFKVEINTVLAVLASASSCLWQVEPLNQNSLEFGPLKENILEAVEASCVLFLMNLAQCCEETAAHVNTYACAREIQGVNVICNIFGWKAV